MFAVIFALALTTAYAAELPSYINVCGRKNPDINQCLLDNFKNLKDKICNGLTEMNIAPLNEPLNIDKLVISETDNSKIYLRDVQITGLCNYYMNSVSVDLDKLHLNFDISFDRLYLNGTYDINVHVLVPIAYKAPIYLTSDNVNGKVSIQAKATTKKGETYIYVSEVKTKAILQGYEAKYGLTKDELGQLGQAISGLIGSNQEEFIERLTPAAEEAVSNWILTICNSVFTKFSYDILFPDRE